MYITITSLKKTLGKYIELTDLFIAVPSLILFIILFSISFTRFISLIFLMIVVLKLKLLLNSLRLIKQQLYIKNIEKL